MNNSHYDKSIFNNKLNAFTLVEVGIVLVIIGVLSALTLTTVFNSPKTNLRKTAAHSSYFYTNISNVFQAILMKYTTNYTLDKLADKNGDGNIDSTDLAGYFAEIAEGELLVANQDEEEETEEGSENASGGDTSGGNASGENPENPENPEDTQEAQFVKHGGGCKGLLISTNSAVSNYGEKAACIDFARLIAGVVYDATCSTTVLTKEYLTKDDVDKIASNPEHEPEHREVKNACGYIIYSMNGGKGEFKKDLFTIPLGKSTIK